MLSGHRRFTGKAAMSQEQTAKTKGSASPAIEPEHSPRLPWRPFLSEAIGTALLVLVGLSLVIMMFGAGSPIPRALPYE